MAAATFMYSSMFGSFASKSNSAPSYKENSLAISCVMNLLVFQLLLIPLVSLHPFSEPPIPTGLHYEAPLVAQQGVQCFKTEGCLPSFHFALHSQLFSLLFPSLSLDAS